MNFGKISEAHLSVMGPGEELSPSNILLPPKIRPETDKLLWREVVFEWADNLCAAAKGGDSRAKGGAVTLGMTLYRSLEFGRKEMVKNAVRTGEIILTPQSEDQHLTQIEVVKKIVDLVAKDSTVDRLRRIVRLYKEINSCVRSEGESISDFVNRFAGAALSYLNLTNAEQESADSQNFAIVLLLNARLTSQTFSNIISNLVASSKNRTSETDSIIPISTNRIATILKVLESDSSSTDLQEESKTSILALRAALDQKTKSHQSGDAKSWIGLQEAILALEEAGLEGKDLEDESKPNEPNDSQSRSFMNTNRMFKKNRKRNRDTDESGNGKQSSTEDAERKMVEAKAVENGTELNQITKRGRDDKREGYKPRPSEKHRQKSSKPFFQ